MNKIDFSIVTTKCIVFFFLLEICNSFSAETMSLSKQVIHYGLQLGFLDYNLTVPHREGTPYPSSWSAHGCGRTWNHHQSQV